MIQNPFDTVILIKRPTRLELLQARFNTKEQAKFFIKQRKVASKHKKINFLKTKFSKREMIQMQQSAISEAEQEFADYTVEHETFYKSFEKVKQTIPKDLKIKILEQKYLPNHIFSENEIIVVVGQDGLVANTAKYVGNLPIIGVNPDTNRYDGLLLPYTPDNFYTALKSVLTGNYKKSAVTMAQVNLNDGQQLLAFNDIFIGINSHASAAYSIEYRSYRENHLSSGIIISTGAGSTGWLSSFFNMTNAFGRYFLKKNIIKHKIIDREAPKLMFVVREPFVSRTSKANIVIGEINADETLIVESNMPQNGIIFTDGVQTDYLEFNSGTIAEISISKQKAILVF